MEGRRVPLMCSVAIHPIGGRAASQKTMRGMRKAHRLELNPAITGGEGEEEGGYGMDGRANSFSFVVSWFRGFEEVREPCCRSTAASHKLTTQPTFKHLPLPVMLLL